MFLGHFGAGFAAKAIERVGQAQWLLVLRAFRIDNQRVRADGPP